MNTLAHITQRVVRDVRSSPLWGLVMLSDDRMNNLVKLLDVAALRSRVHAANLANQNTPGFRARAVEFDESFREALQRSQSAGQAVTPTVYEPRSTPVQNDGNDVSVDHEVASMAKNQVLYNTYIQLMRGKNRIISTAIRESP